MRSVYDAIKSILSIYPAAYTADQNGQAAVDTKGYNSGKLVVAAGVLDNADGNETYVVNVEESDTGSSGWTAVSGWSITLDKTADDNTVKNLRLEGFGLAGRKRYLRAVLDVGGTTPSAVVSAVFELGRAYHEPVQ